MAAKWVRAMGATMERGRKAVDSMRVVWAAHWWPEQHLQKHLQGMSLFVQKLPVGWLERLSLLALG